MARWKLMAPHYLNLAEPTEWEYMEIANGKQQRKRFVIPRMLDPRDPSDWNSRWGRRSSATVVGNEEGEIIVALRGKGEAGDYEFIGEPTPDMMPIDDEAQAISNELSGKWKYKPDNADTSYSQSMVDGLREVFEAQPQQTVKIEGLENLGALLAQLVENNTQLTAQHVRRA